MKQAKVLSKSDVKRLIAVIDAGQHAARNKCAFYLTYYAGLRVKEVAALTVGDLFNEDGSVFAQITLSADHTKGNRARTVILSSRLRRFLREYFLALPKTNKDFPIIFSQKSYRAFSANSLCQLFARLYRSAGINGATSHSGRRSFITKLASKGVSARVLMQLAGHRHLSTTQRYIEVNDQMLKEAIELM